MLFVLKLIAGAFLVSVNIFTFLLIKFQKADRDKLLLAGVASGEPEDYQPQTEPQKQEVQSARNVLLSEDAENSPKDDNKDYSHIDAAPDSGGSSGSKPQNTHAKEGTDSGADTKPGSGADARTSHGHKTDTGADKPHSDASVGLNSDANSDNKSRDTAKAISQSAPYAEYSVKSGDNHTSSGNNASPDSSSRDNHRSGKSSGDRKGDAEDCSDQTSPVEGSSPSDKDSLSKKQRKHQKQKLVQKYGVKPVSDLKLILCAVLGGSLGIYVALFVYKYRLRDILMMVFVPTLLVLNAYVYISIFSIWLIQPVAAALVASAV